MRLARGVGQGHSWRLADSTHQRSARNTVPLLHCWAPFPGPWTHASVWGTRGSRVRKSGCARWLGGCICPVISGEAVLIAGFD